MRTQIRYKTGEVQTYDDAAPSVNTQEKTLTLVANEMVVLEAIPLQMVEKVVFVP